MAGDEWYEINDGIRRAKAALLTGRSMIRATIDGAPTARGVPLDSLRVPRANVGKHTIDITREAAEERWLDTYVRTSNGEVPPPIDVRSAPRSDGVPLREVPASKRGKQVDPLSGE